MERYFHSVRLDKEKCRGCTNCIKRCPTEAIRVREGKARIIDMRCIDCGECIRACPNHAKYAVTDSLEILQKFKYNVALIAPSLLGQFKPKITPQKILEGILGAGFDDVFEVAQGAEIVSFLTEQYLKENSDKKPVISTACPVILRLIQVRFPNLLDNMLPINTPMHIAAKLARDKAVRETGLPPENIGVIFITPCPAKVTAIRQPEGVESVGVDGAISMQEIYPLILQNISKSNGQKVLKSSGLGIGWARAGGEAMALKGIKTLAVDGIHNVISVLEEVELGRFDDIDYLECNSCIGGCVGGVLTVENSYVARVRIRDIAENNKCESEHDYNKVLEEFKQGQYRFLNKFEPRPIMQLDDDVVQAMRKLERLEETLKNLPQLDCGSCGSPNCRALAEDIVQGMAAETDCIFKLRSEVEKLATNIMELAHKVPPAMGTERNSGRGEEK